VTRGGEWEPQISFETLSHYHKITTQEPTHKRAVRSRPNRWVDTLGDVLEVQRIYRGRNNPSTQRTTAKQHLHHRHGLSAQRGRTVRDESVGLSGGGARTVRRLGVRKHDD
jgi:hypothetical protein